MEPLFACLAGHSSVLVMGTGWAEPCHVMQASCPPEGLLWAPAAPGPMGMWGQRDDLGRSVTWTACLAQTHTAQKPPWGHSHGASRGLKAPMPWLL